MWRAFELGAVGLAVLVGGAAAGTAVLWLFTRLTRRDDTNDLPLTPPVPRPGFGKLSPAEADAMREQSRLRRKRADDFKSDSHKTATKDADSNPFARSRTRLR